MIRKNNFVEYSIEDMMDVANKMNVQLFLEKVKKHTDIMVSVQTQPQSSAHPSSTTTTTAHVTPVAKEMTTPTTVGATVPTNAGLTTPIAWLMNQRPIVLAKELITSIKSVLESVDSGINGLLPTAQSNDPSEQGTVHEIPPPFPDTSLLYPNLTTWKLCDFSELVVVGTHGHSNFFTYRLFCNYDMSSCLFKTNYSSLSICYRLACGKNPSWYAGVT
jgi:hypothetical protein